MAAADRPARARRAAAAAAACCEPLEPRRLLTANVWIDDWDTPASAPEGGGVSFTVMAFDADETAFT
ncbi:MAG TPA: hypothetical protein VK324_06320, partial [Tepidisphaeraceae bacterium]|nr:hypothetical protein [Tepidisphaeraceae bacterium]